MMSFPLNIYPEVGLMEHIAVLFKFLEKSPQWFSMGVTQIHINSAQELCFLQIPTNTCYFTPFGNSHSNRYG